MFGILNHAFAVVSFACGRPRCRKTAGTVSSFVVDDGEGEIRDEVLELESLFVIDIGRDGE